ncbi:MAG: hypothetical protein ACOC1X_03020 [Promethearchaeota archaeon]
MSEEKHLENCPLCGEELDEVDSKRADGITEDTIDFIYEKILICTNNECKMYKIVIDSNRD